MPSYKMTNGERVEKSVIDYRVRKAKERKIEMMMLEHGYVFCEEVGCGKNANCGEPIDCSHDISVDECQKMGITEWAWDVKNITMRCRTCHKIHDKTIIGHPLTKK
ncbi:hypothetical protein [Flagellimonas nanhaiensis]|uniref:Uncharacterized protein n=1 Tax=Flagellimonas nanhaiensis TaxID=2292706 RepID=A0A371JMW8_9FLAO|nr:hypothetical protein [Allomuricauda nanhaiensis]RDY58480.1 hypothetical protein DX873_15885 [Allomuricauda nanhaiensis]